MKRKLHLIGKYYLIIFVIVHVVSWSSDFEIIDDTLIGLISFIKIVTIPIAILLTALGIKDGKFNNYDVLIVTIITFGTTIFYYFILLFVTVFDMCDYTNRKTLFQNKSDKNITIISREFGCGAFDSSPNSNHIEKAYSFLGLIENYSRIDTNKINKKEWIRVEKMGN